MIYHDLPVKTRLRQNPNGYSVKFSSLDTGMHLVMHLGTQLRRHCLNGPGRDRLFGDNQTLSSLSSCRFDECSPAWFASLACHLCCAWCHDVTCLCMFYICFWRIGHGFPTPWILRWHVSCIKIYQNILKLSSMNFWEYIENMLRVYEIYCHWQRFILSHINNGSTLLLSIPNGTRLSEGQKFEDAPNHQTHPETSWNSVCWCLLFSSMTILTMSILWVPLQKYGQTTRKTVSFAWRNQWISPTLASPLGDPKRNSPSIFHCHPQGLTSSAALGLIVKHFPVSLGLLDFFFGRPKVRSCNLQWPQHAATCHNRTVQFDDSRLPTILDTHTSGCLNWQAHPPKGLPKLRSTETLVPWTSHRFP